jgi:hypothetical protein
MASPTMTGEMWISPVSRACAKWACSCWKFYRNLARSPHHLLVKLFCNARRFDCVDQSSPRATSNRAAFGLITGSDNGGALGIRMGKGFLAGIESGAAQAPCGTQHQCGGKAAPVSDTACRDHWSFPREIHDGGNQRKSRAAPAMTSRLSPLSDNNIRAAIEGFSSLREVLHLHDQARRGASNLVAERPDAAEGQEDGGRLPIERKSQKIRLLSERPADEPDTNAGIADRLEFRVSHVWSPYSPPMKPSPPAWVTAAANAPPLMPAIGVDMTGCWMPSSAVTAV